eukprot:12904981-Alexandrium_andersonii.AAC.1
MSRSCGAPPAQSCDCVIPGGGDSASTSRPGGEAGGPAKGAGLTWGRGGGLRGEAQSRVRGSRSHQA